MGPMLHFEVTAMRNAHHKREHLIQGLLLALLRVPLPLVPQVSHAPVLTTRERRISMLVSGVDRTTNDDLGHHYLAMKGHSCVVHRDV